MFFDDPNRPNPYVKEDGFPPSWESFVQADFEFAISEQNLAEMGHTAAWTVLSYIAADCDRSAATEAERLTPLLFDDLMQLKRVGSMPDIHLCAFFDGPLIGDAFLARLHRGTKLSADFLFRFTDVDSSNPDVLGTMVSRVNALYLAERRLLFLSGHGNGWRGLLLDRQNGRDYIQKMRTRQDYLLVIDKSLKQAQDAINLKIDEIHAQPPEPLCDILALDACYMANLETLTVLAPFASVLLASQTQFPGDGYPYDKILKALALNPSVATRDLALQIMRCTKLRYQADRTVTQIALDTGKLTDFVVSLGPLFASVEANLDRPGLDRLLTSLWTCEYTESVDLKGLLLGLAAFAEPVAALAKESLARWDAMTLDTLLDPSASPRPNGISIYAPSKRRQVSSEYSVPTPTFTPHASLLAWKSLLSRQFT